jgi:hypothetical protein
MSESHKKKACPKCAKRAPRIVSAFAIASGAADIHAGQEPLPTPHNQNQRPMCMRYPQVPLSCHMDAYSVKRFAAHSVGRGNEFDDKMATATETRQQRGIPEPKYAPPSHGHAHEPGHDHAHKPKKDEHNFRRHAPTQMNMASGESHTHTNAQSHSHSQGKKQKGHSHAAHTH